MTAPDAVPPQEAIEAVAKEIGYPMSYDPQCSAPACTVCTPIRDRAEAALAAAYPAIREAIEAEVRQSFDTSVVPDICFHEDECTEDHCPCDDAGGDR